MAFGYGNRMPATMPVDLQEIDWNTLQDGTGETTQDMSATPGRVAFLPSMAQRTATTEQPRVNPLEVLDRLFGIGVTDAIDESRARRRNLDRQAELDRVLAGINPDNVGYADLAPILTKAAVAGRDLESLTSLLEAQKPKVGVDGGTAYTIGPDGTVRWGEQRPESPAERLRREADEERQKQNDFMNALRERQLLAQLDRYAALTRQGDARVSQGNARIGLSRAAGARAAAKAGGGGAGLPPPPPRFRRVTPGS